MRSPAAVLLCSLFILVSSPAAGGHRLLAMKQSPAIAKPVDSPDKKGSQKTGPVEKPAALPTGTIKGRVVANDGRPVTNAIVQAHASTTPSTQKSTRSDTEGRFVFDELPAAAYVVFATAPGYIDQSLAVSDPGEWPRYFIGTQLKITMIKGGVITGTITDSKGQPVVGVPVSADPTNATPTFGGFMRGTFGVNESDDRGIYRIFGLLPGDYTVVAGGGGPFGQYTASGFDLDVLTYYPSATHDTALPVTVTSGEETSGIDIKYRGGEGHSLSGVVTGAIGDSAAMGAVTVFLSPAGSNSVVSMAIANAVGQRRAFGFNGVEDGDYDVTTSFLTNPNDEPLVGKKRVAVRGGDVTGIELKLAHLGAISGTIALEPIKPEATCDKRGSQVMETVITTQRDEPKKSGSSLVSGWFGLFGGSLNARGEFAARSLEAGKYRLAIRLPTEAWYVRSIIPPAAATRAPQGVASTTQRPADAWQGVVNVNAGERAGPVSITISQDAAGLRGRLSATTGKGTLPAGLRVHVVPAEREQANNLLRFGETLVERDGSFGLTNLAPGRYFIVARVEPVAETDSKPRPSAWDAATRLKLRRDAETANTIVELKPCQQLADYTLPFKGN